MTQQEKDLRVERLQEDVRSIETLCERYGCKPVSKKGRMITGILLYQAYRANPDPIYFFTCIRGGYFSDLVEGLELAQQADVDPE